MAYKSLRDFIDILEAEGELVRVSEPVSTHLEMTEIQTRLLRNGGPAVIFEKPVMPDGSISPIPCLANLFGTVKRVAMGVTLEKKSRTTAAELREVGELLAFLRNPTPPRGLGDAMEMLPLAQTVMSMRPKTVKTAPVQQVVLKGDAIDLTSLPIQGCWPGEPAPLITWGLVVTKGPSDAREDDFNLGIYRMQVLGKDRAIMRWLAHRGGAQHYARHKKAGAREPLPAAIVLGADPGTILAAVTPVPDTLSEYQFAGLLRGQKAELVPCKTVPLMVPAQAEIVLEGHVLLDEHAAEGPYGDHTGYYNSVETFPVFQVTAITMRKDPIYLTTFTGRPPDEPSVLGEALNEVFIPLLQLPHRRRVDEEGLPRPRQARDARRLELSAPVHVHQVGHRRGRRHRRPGLERGYVGDLHQDGPGARHHPDREHPDRLSGFRQPRERTGLQDRPRRHRQVGTRDEARVGRGNPHGFRRRRTRLADVGSPRVAG
jgi:4-hydroxy-3-polyprenylbenzoate decarboxylase